MESLPTSTVWLDLIAAVISEAQKCPISLRVYMFAGCQHVLHPSINTKLGAFMQITTSLYLGPA